MLVGGRLSLILIISLSSSLLLNIKGDFINTKERRKRHIFPLLGYLHGYKIGQNFALQLPPFVLSPVIIVPSVNQQQSVNIQKGATDESFQENGSTFQTIMPVKLILNTSLEDIETNFKSSVENNSVEDEKVLDLNDTFRQINEETTTSTEENTERGELVSTTENFETAEIEELTTLKSNTTTTNGVYPTAMYNNDLINSLQLTTAASEIVLGLPSMEDKWQTFISNANKTNETENIETELENSASARVSSYQPTERYHVTTETYPYTRPNTRFYSPYPAWYNAKVDQFSITTNSYRGEKKELPLPPPQDDRWHRFSSLSKVVSPVSGFKPLAGLYYDGYLHKSLTKKTGFVPFDKHYYY
ncbi:uncharacterized protein [Epargyreus clarus]|uniref:uncharacterized protein n=1 Tax=Epargyreus clarus TaxID=520877 RepID=UPI003C2D48B7